MKQSYVSFSRDGIMCILKKYVGNWKYCATNGTKDLCLPSNPLLHGSGLEMLIVPLNPYFSLQRGPQKQITATVVLVVGPAINYTWECG